MRLAPTHGSKMWLMPCLRRRQLPFVSTWRPPKLVSIRTDNLSPPARHYNTARVSDLREMVRLLGRGGAPMAMRRPFDYWHEHGLKGDGLTSFDGNLEI